MDDDVDDVVVVIVVKPVGGPDPAGSRGKELVAALMADCMPRGRVVARDSPPYSNSSSVSSSPADAPATINDRFSYLFFSFLLNGVNDIDVFGNIIHIMSAISSCATSGRQMARTEFARLILDRI